eukprot:1957867-Rhodomonas_salina.1
MRPAPQRRGLMLPHILRHRCFRGRARSSARIAPRAAHRHDIFPARINMRALRPVPVQHTRRVLFCAAACRVWTALSGGVSLSEHGRDARPRRDSPAHDRVSSGTIASPAADGPANPPAAAAAPEERRDNSGRLAGAVRVGGSARVSPFESPCQLPPLAPLGPLAVALGPCAFASAVAFGPSLPTPAACNGPQDAKLCQWHAACETRAQRELESAHCSCGNTHRGRMEGRVVPVRRERYTRSVPRFRATVQLQHYKHASVPSDVTAKDTARPRTESADSIECGTGERVLALAFAAVSDIAGFEGCTCKGRTGCAPVVRTAVTFLRFEACWCQMSTVERGRGMEAPPRVTDLDNRFRGRVKPSKQKKVEKNGPGSGSL